MFSRRANIAARTAICAIYGYVGALAFAPYLIDRTDARHLGNGGTRLVYGKACTVFADAARTRMKAGSTVIGIIRDLYADVTARPEPIYLTVADALIAEAHRV